MTKNELLMMFLQKHIYDMTFYEAIQPWSDIDYSKEIHNLNITINTTCRNMDLIGKEHFWVHEKGIQGYGGRWVDVKKRYNLFNY